MTRRQDIDEILQTWEFSPEQVSTRLIKASNGRQVLQMRIDLGLLQLETTGRPDGAHPGGQETYLDYLMQLSFRGGEEFELSPEQCQEVDREFLQYYHRRLCWLQLREFKLAADDAEHTLSFMDFVSEYCSDDQWIMAHEQYRPFVMFHHVQAATLGALDEKGPEGAIEQLNDGLATLRNLYEEYGLDEEFEGDEMIMRLHELRDSIRERFDVKKTLKEQLDQAIEEEQYELAARLRDKLAREQT